MKYSQFLDLLLRTTKTRMKSITVAQGVFLMLSLTIFIALLAVILDHVTGLGILARYFFLALLIVTCAAVASTLIVRPLVLKISDKYVAKQIEQHYPEFRNTLISSVEFENKGKISPEIQHQVEKRAAERGQRVNPGLVVSARWFLWSFGAFLAVAIVFAAYAALSTKDVLASLGRINPGSPEAAPTSTTIEKVVYPRRITGRRPFEIHIHLKGKSPESVAIQYVATERLDQPQEGDSEGVTWLTKKADARGPYDWVALLDNHPGNTTFYVIAGDYDQSQHGTYQKVQSVLPARIAELHIVRIIPPAYTGKPEPDTPDPQERIEFSVPEGSTIEFEGTTNNPRKPNKRAWFHFRYDAEGRRHQRSIPFLPNQPKHLRVQPMVAWDDFVFQIEYVDAYDNANEEPTESSIAVVRDQPPTLTVLGPDPDGDVLISEKPLLSFSWEDDYGISSMALEYRILLPGERGAEIQAMPFNLKEAQAPKGAYEGPLPLKAMGAAPGARIYWRLTAEDNRELYRPHKKEFEPAYQAVESKWKFIRIDVLKPGEEARAEDELAKEGQGDEEVKGIDPEEPGSGKDKLREMEDLVEKIAKEMEEKGLIDPIEPEGPGPEDENIKALDAAQTTLLDILKKQTAIHNDTQALDKDPNNLDAVGRKETLEKARELAKGQADLSEPVRQLAAEPTLEAFSEVFPWLFKKIAGDMTEVSNRLVDKDAFDLGAETQTLQQDILDDLEMMVDAMKQAKQDIAREQQNPPEDGVSIPVAEVSVLKIMQQKLVDRTKRFHGAHPNPAQYTKAEAQQIGRLKNNQEEILTVSQLLIKKIQQSLEERKP